MQASRFASNTGKLVALTALSLGCIRCSSDAADTGASAGAGASSSAGAHAGSAAHTSAGAPAQGGSGIGGGGSSDAGAAQAGTDSAGLGGAGEEPAEVILDFNGCTAADYEDRSDADAERIIGIATQGLSFTPPCLTVAVGQGVRWQGSLGSHPLAPGNPDDPDAGSPDSPIIATDSGQSVEFTFNDAGTFPYYCVLHSFGDGQGMAGVVHVKP